jgi:outer membrane lipoprotein SlyB
MTMNRYAALRGLVRVLGMGMVGGCASSLSGNAYIRRQARRLREVILGTEISIQSVSEG